MNTIWSSSAKVKDFKTKYTRIRQKNPTHREKENIVA